MTVAVSMKQEQAERILPKGWKWVRLGDICKTTSGGTPSRGISEYYGGDIAWVKSGELNDTPIFNTEETITHQGLANSSAKLFPPETLLIALYGATVGKLGLLKIEAATNQAVCAIFPDKNTINDYLFFYLLSIRNLLLEISFGGAQPNISQQIIRDVLIPLPPLEEQERIVAILNEKMEAIAVARKATLAQIEAAEALPAAYLRQVFDSPEAQKWERKQLGELVNIQSGYAFKSEWFTSDGIRLLRNANIFQGFINWQDTVFIPYNKKKEFSSFELFENDIVLTLDRPLVNNGLKVARLSKHDVPSLLLQRVARFHIGEYLTSDYLYHFLNSPQFIEAISGHDQSIGVPHISPKQVEAVKIPFPTKDKQREISIELSRKIDTAKSVYIALQSQLEAINALPAAILRQAFNGEL